MTSSPFTYPRQARGRTLSGVCIATLAVASLGFDLRSASAQDLKRCQDLPNPVFGIGGSAATPLIGRIAAQLAGANPPITLVYADPGACAAMGALVPKGSAPVKSIPALLKNPAQYWTPDAPTAAKTCTFDVGDATLADWGAMAQLPATCPDVTGLSADVGDFIGPISGLSLIVPKDSTENSISAEALYYIYGLGVGTGHDIAPWNIPGAIGSRKKDSAVGLLLAKAAGIPAATTLFGKDVEKNEKAIDFVTGTLTGSPAPGTNPSAALAFCSTETVNGARDKVRTLAFQARGQNCAYTPDSDFAGTNSNDKKNLREGRYFLWNPHHFFAKVDPVTKKVVNPNLAKFINIVTSLEELPSSTASTAALVGDRVSTFLDLTIKNGNVPQCAMHVTRTEDVGPLSSFQPEKECGCYFDFKTTGSNACTACTTNANCPASAPSCNFGYCEVK